MRNAVQKENSEIREPMLDTRLASGGEDSNLEYINLLCDRFKNRGVSTRAKVDAEVQAERERKTRRALTKSVNVRGSEVSPYDSKYRTGTYNGVSYMSSDDFAKYYKDLRDYKLPGFRTRPSSEYEAARKVAEGSEAGTPPKKAKWLAIAEDLTARIKRIPSHINAEEFEKFSSEWFPIDEHENRIEGKKTHIPSGILPSMTVLTVSLLLIVSSSVMVSRAQSAVSQLESDISELEEVKDDLETDLEIKNNMLSVKDIASGQYGMVNGDYVNARYLDVGKDETVERFERAKKGSALSSFLDAIGLTSE